MRDNIELFGGDSNNVHIFGHSAGSMLVHYIMFSPKAKVCVHQCDIRLRVMVNEASGSF